MDLLTKTIKMRTFFITLIGFGCFVCLPFSFGKPANMPDDKKFPALLPEKTSGNSLAVKFMDSVYTRLRLSGKGLKKDVFYKAYKGYQLMLNEGYLSNKDYLTIVDYSQSSHNKRLYVINLRTGRLVFNTFVSHGKMSGKEFATSFSNTMNSNKSSLGFMVTGDTYFGRAGYSLRLHGKEEGYNSNVFNRGVVMHGSDYVNAQRAEEGIDMGRSYGCPAIPKSVSKEIINTVSGGSCFFVWAPDRNYTRSSAFLNAKVTWPELQELVKKENIKASEKLRGTSAVSLTNVP